MQPKGPLCGRCGDAFRKGGFNCEYKSEQEAIVACNADPVKNATFLGAKRCLDPDAQRLFCKADVACHDECGVSVSQMFVGPTPDQFKKRFNRDAAADAGYKKKDLWRPDGLCFKGYGFLDDGTWVHEVMKYHYFRRLSVNSREFRMTADYTLRADQREKVLEHEMKPQARMLPPSPSCIVVACSH